jgi:hypothetical protein
MTIRSPPCAFAESTSEPPSWATWIWPESSAGTPLELEMFCSSPASMKFLSK